MVHKPLAALALKLTLIGLAGGLGALARYGLAGAVQRLTGAGFPWGTLVVNLLGCFLFGLVVAFCEDRLTISDQMRIVILAGFMGAFTTFSTFAYETGGLLRDGQWLAASANLVVQNVVGVAALLIGLAAGRAV